MKAIKKQKFLTTVILAVLFALTVFFALRYGSSKMDIREFFSGLIRKDGYEKQSLILYSIRLPRVFGAIIAGAGLSLSGVLLQAVTGNDLAAPNIIGVNAGAGFFVILLLYFLPEISALLPLAAFLGAFLACMVILGAAHGAGGSKTALILSGVALTAMLNAAISFISLLDTDVLSAYNYFSVGSLSAVLSQELLVPAVLVVLCILASVVLSEKIEILCLGDTMAKSLGVNVGAIRVVCLMLASASAAAAVSFAGLLGFVGLVVPHVAKKISRAKISTIIIHSVLLGAIVVVLGDLLGRVLLSPTEIPVGIMMAMVGAPFFFYLLLRKRRDFNA